MGALIEIDYRNGEIVQGGVEIQPMSQERRHGGVRLGDDPLIFLKLDLDRMVEEVMGELQRGKGGLD